MMVIDLLDAHSSVSPGCDRHLGGAAGVWGPGRHEWGRHDSEKLPFPEGPEHTASGCGLRRTPAGTPCLIKHMGAIDMQPIQAWR